MDHRIRKARDHFAIQEPEDWQSIRPEWIRSLDGCGPKTLDLLRVYLAARGLTLKDDGTPNFWNQNLAATRIGGQIAVSDTAVTEPFTILIDQQEKQPWTFQGFIRQNKTLLVPIQWKSLGASHGDYAIAGMESLAHVERKSQSDAQGTFLAPPDSDRGIRWRNTLSFLAEIPCGGVVVECSLGMLIANIESHGKRSKDTLKKQIHSNVIAWQYDYGLPFLFCDHRRLAEATALKILRRYWAYETGQKRKRSSNDINAAIAAL